MPTLMDERDREALVARIQNLEPDLPPLWGKMDCHRIICHLADQLRVALGDAPSRWRYPFFLRPILRFAVVHLPLPAPRGKVPTVPEMLVSKPEEWTTDHHALLDLIERLPEADRLHPHPAFGHLTRREWGLLGWKHIDHHLRQFGC